MYSLEQKQYWLEQFVNSSHIGVLVVDKDRNNLFVNKYLCTLFGYTEDEFINANAEIVHVDHDSYLRFAEEAFSFVLEGKAVGIDYQLKKKDGTFIWCHIAGDLVKNKNEVLWTIVDITKRKEAEKSLEEANYNMNQYLDVIDKIDIGLFVVDDDYRVRFMNTTMMKWFGDQQGKTCYSSVANLDSPCSYCKLQDVIKKNKKVTYEPTTPDGQSFDIVATSVKNSDGTMSKMEVVRNVTEQKKIQQSLLEQQRMLHYQAHHDALTGLPNRILFNDRLELAIQKANRNNTTTAVFFIDLDHFKEINDSLGHDVGDSVLKIISDMLKDTIRKEDTLARLGGDEFTVIIENLTQGQDASLLAKKILDVLANPIIVSKNKLYISSSIGISLYPDDGRSVQDLLKYADSAMYKAKAEGRNNFQFYSSEMTELAFERVVMETSLRVALKNNELVVYYQPQINGKSGKIIGIEALVRWQHPTMGMIPPAKFIPLAEATGLIVELDRFVMKTAMKQLAKWYAKGLNPGKLAMNLAVKQLQQQDFIQVLKNLMKETGCKPQWIALEVTESQIMSRPEVAIKILNQISATGVELAVDDFGTGYSSLAYLKKLPIDKLKIDQSFVKDLPDDEDDKTIAKAVIALATSLNLKIIAEGVESKEQKDFLIKNGCENIQGYYYSKPIPADKFEVFLVNGSSKNKML
jgi:diguanylate cyclase (GGDEF)-like protein/PAS domain S-box-containing protein